MRSVDTRPFLGFWTDVRFAVRSSRAQPGFFVAAVLTLALGIGATTAIFSVVNGVLINPLAYPDSGALVSIVHAIGGVDQPYFNDAIYHGQMEPMNATALVRGDEVELWAGTQAMTRTTNDVAKALGTTPEKVRLHQQLLGGGYGRRATVESSIDAAMVSKAVGKPVKLILSREDDLWAGTFRPMTVQRI